MGASRGGRGRTGPPHTKTGSGLAVDFCPPPANPDKEESPVAEEFGRLAFKSMADELKNPAHHEERQRVKPQAMDEERGNEDYHGNQNRGDAEGMADAVDGVLVTSRVSRDPLLVVISAQHAEKMILRREARRSRISRSCLGAGRSIPGPT